MTTRQQSTDGMKPASTGHVVVGLDASSEAAHALAWAVDYAADEDLSVEVVTIWSFPALSLELPSTGRILHRHALDLANHAVDLVTADRAAEGKPVPTINVEAYLAQPADRLVRASRGADLLVVGRGRRSRLGSTSRAVTHHATCPVVVIPSPASDDPSNSLSVRLAADHPDITAAVESVSQHLSAMGI